MLGSAAPNASGQWPFMGRERELEAIAAACADVSCRGVVIAAAAGVGKSRLAREAVAAATRARAHTRWVTATRSAAAVPLAAVAELVPEDVGSDDIVVLMRRCGEELRAAGGGRPILLAIDDAQLLDQVSAALVLHLARTGAAFVLATVRAGEPCPDAVTALWKDEGAHRLELAEFDEGQIEQLVETALGAPVQAEALEWVRTVGQGNALYVRELIRGAVDAGTLHLVDGFWRLDGTPAASGSLVELVGARLAGLTDEQRRAVQLLALGEPLALDEIVGLTSEDTVIELEEFGLLRTSGRAIGLAHPLYGEAALRALAPLRARRMRLTLADVLTVREPLGDDDALRAARLLLDAEDEVPRRLAAVAAAAANRAGDPELGVQLALAAGAAENVAAAILLSRAHSLLSRYAEAEAALIAVEPIVTDDAQVSEYAGQRLWISHWGLRRPAAEMTALADRSLTWSTDPAWPTMIGRWRESYLALANGFGAPEQFAPLDHTVTDEGRRNRRVIHTLALFMHGEADEACELAFTARPPVPLRDNGDAAMLATLVLIAPDAGGRWPELWEYLSDALRRGVRTHDHTAAGLTAMGLARLRYLAGANRDAARWAAESEVHLQRHDPFNARIGLGSLQVGIAAAGGDFDATMAALERLRSFADGHPPQRTQRVPMRRAEGWATRLRNPAEAGRQLLLDAEEVSDQPPLAAALAYDALRCGVPAAAPVLERLAARCTSRLASAYAAHGAAITARDGKGLVDAGEAMAAIGADRYAVEAFSDAARVFLAEGRQDSARRAAARARQLHPEDQGGALPAIDGLDATAVALTAREAQLVGLASQGLSNADIADRLVISVRTVETHLYRGMQKLGVSDRRDLTAGGR